MIQNLLFLKSIKVLKHYDIISYIDSSCSKQDLRKMYFFMIFRGDEMLDLISVLVNSVVVHLTSIVSTPRTPPHPDCYFAKLLAQIHLTNIPHPIVNLSLKRS